MSGPESGLSGTRQSPPRYSLRTCSERAQECSSPLPCSQRLWYSHFGGAARRGAAAIYGVAPNEVGCQSRVKDDRCRVAFEIRRTGRLDSISYVSYIISQNCKRESRGLCKATSRTLSCPISNLIGFQVARISRCRVSFAAVGKTVRKIRK